MSFHVQESRGQHIAHKHVPGIVRSTILDGHTPRDLLTGHSLPDEFLGHRNVCELSDRRGHRVLVVLGSRLIFGSHHRRGIRQFLDVGRNRAADLDRDAALRRNGSQRTSHFTTGSGAFDASGGSHLDVGDTAGQAVGENHARGIGGAAVRHHHLPRDDVTGRGGILGLDLFGDRQVDIRGQTRGDRGRIIARITVRRCCGDSGLIGEFTTRFGRNHPGDLDRHGGTTVKRSAFTGDRQALHPAGCGRISRHLHIGDPRRQLIGHGHVGRSRGAVVHRLNRPGHRRPGRRSSAENVLRQRQIHIGDNGPGAGVAVVARGGVIRSRPDLSTVQQLPTRRGNDVSGDSDGALLADSEIEIGTRERPTSEFALHPGGPGIGDLLGKRVRHPDVPRHRRPVITHDEIPLDLLPGDRRFGALALRQRHIRRGTQRSGRRRGVIVGHGVRGSTADASGVNDLTGCIGIHRTDDLDTRRRSGSQRISRTQDASTIDRTIEATVVDDPDIGQLLRQGVADHGWLGSRGAMVGHGQPPSERRTCLWVLREDSLVQGKVRRWDQLILGCRGVIARVRVTGRRRDRGGVRDLPTSTRVNDSGHRHDDRLARSHRGSSAGHDAVSNLTRNIRFLGRGFHTGYTSGHLVSHHHVTCHGWAVVGHPQPPRRRLSRDRRRLDEFLLDPHIGRWTQRSGDIDMVVS